jgi:hypothetical protein
VADLIHIAADLIHGTRDTGMDKGRSTYMQFSSGRDQDFVQLLYVPHDAIDRPCDNSAIVDITLFDCLSCSGFEY